MKVKRKGAYEYELGWHQNRSALVIPMAAEAFLTRNQPIVEYINLHENKWNFMLRTKIPKSSRLVWQVDGVDYPQQNVTRYYISTIGGYLYKIMPPLKEQTEPRRISIDVGWKTTPCNQIEQAIAPIDFDYYIQEAEKLVLGLR